MTILLRSLSILLCFLCLLPLGGLSLIVWGEGVESSEIIRFLQESERSRTILFRTILVAFVVAILSTAYGLFFALRFRRESRLWQLVLGGGHGLVLFVSPFVYTQGWINLIGTGGSFRDLVSRAGVELPELYGNTGWVLLCLIQFAPIAALISVLTIRPLAREFYEDITMSSFSRLERLVTLRLAESVRPMIASFGITFLFCFWNWEVPSMLRQTSYPLEVMSFFGSFYDYTQAFVAASLPILGTALFGCLFWFSFSKLGFRYADEGTSAEAASPESLRNRKLTRAFLILIPILGLAIPLLALIQRIESLSSFETVFRLFPGEVSRTLELGLWVGGSTTLLALVIESQVRTWGSNSRFVTSVAWCAIGIPAILNGIGLAKLLSTPELSSLVLPKERFLLAELIAFLPLAIILIGISTDFWRKSWTDFAVMTRNPILFFSVGIPAGGGRYFLIFLALGSFAMRDVAIALANHHPGGSTLALTIETVLHFDQPETVSVLCVLQLLCVVGFWLAGGLVLQVGRLTIKRYGNQD